jgi:SAM-dependent methyltransferase
MRSHLMLKKLKRRFVTTLWPHLKSQSELTFWKDEIGKYIKWFNGEVDQMYGCLAPKDHEKVHSVCANHSSILTWHKLLQEKKYLSLLELGSDAFSGCRILDVGSGPIPSATCFTDSELYCLDPLMGDYLKAGFPIHYYDNVRFVCSFAERMPFPDNFFDAVITVNALDHVDNVKQSAREMQRVLKPNGVLRMHLHYHAPTLLEPISFSDAMVQSIFANLPSLRKIHSLPIGSGKALAPDEQFSLWST